MALPMKVPDQPMSPGSKMLFKQVIDSIIFFTFGFRDPIDIETFKAGIRSSRMLQVPRFQSVVVLDENSGAVRGWRKVPQLDIDRHVILVPEASEDGSKSGGMDAVHDYMAALAVGCPMTTDKPMWEFHVFVAHQCAVLRVHHAVGDGVSIASMIRSCFQTKVGRVQPVNQRSEGQERRKGRKWLDRVESWWCNLKFIMEFSARSLLVGDRKTAISGGAGREFWARKVASATFLLADMKLIKCVVPDATVNDVLFTVLSTGLSRYLKNRSSRGLQRRLRVTCACMVNLRDPPGPLDLPDVMETKPKKSLWGNRFGVFHLPVYCHKAATMHPMEYLKNVAKPLLDKKKKSLEAHFGFKIHKLAASWLGAKFGSLLTYRMLCNTTFLISNIMGPPEEIAIGGNRVTYLGASVSSLPQALTIHMVSYAGKANLEIMVAEDVINDPAFLAEHFETAFAQMKAAVSTDER